MLKGNRGVGNGVQARIVRAEPSIRKFNTIAVVGHSAPEQTRTEMVDWLKANFTKAKVVALIPSASYQVLRADYNIVLNDGEEWRSLLAATAS